jgi:protein-tyrosine phosphatase
VNGGIEPDLTPLPMPLGGWDPLGMRPRYGTYRGSVRLFLAHLEDLAGGFGSLRRIRWDSVGRVVFVCAGNICRSPYAERRAATYGLDVASFGLSAATGSPAYPSARRIAAARGIDLAAHRSCSTADFKLRAEDLLVAMEPRQSRAMRRQFSSAPCQLTLLGLWSRPRRPHIHDPHRLGEAYWEQCFDIVDSAVQTIAEHMGRKAPRAR